MNNALMAFLVHYMLYKRHGVIRKELNVKTPIGKRFDMKPEIFGENSLESKLKS